MIIINHCLDCRRNFLIPIEFTDCLDKTCFICPHCFSSNWKRLSDGTILTEELRKNQNIILR